jgi:hypothetical protein
MSPLIDAIMAIKPRTLAALAVIARAFTLHHAEQWEPSAMMTYITEHSWKRCARSLASCQCR